MKYMPLDLPAMNPEPFPCSLITRSGFPGEQPSAGERWRGRIDSARTALQTLVHQCRQRIEQEEMVRTVLSVMGACAFGLVAVGIFWLAVEMDNSQLQAAKSSCSSGQ